MRPIAALTPPFDDLLPGKLHPPRPRVQGIARPRLLTRLDASTATVTLVVAPAGAGKTTLLARWALDRAHAVAWLSLSPRDDSLTRFAVYVVAALTTVDAGLADRVRRRVLASDEPEAWALPAAVLNEVARSDGGWVLVLDDYHTITQPEIHAFMADLLEVLPEGGRLVIASRSEPPLALARRQVSGDLTLLDHRDLAATASECAELFGQHGIALTDEQRRTVLQRTAGWLVALHCVLLACRTHPVEQLLATPAPRGAELEVVHDYLFQEVLAQQPEALQRFLLSISVLERFTADTCYVVTGDAAASQFLEQARRGGLFVVALDEDGTWFRFHSLFGEFLRRRLALEVDPPTVRALHAAASRWFSAHNLVDEAIAHAIHAEDWTAAATHIVAIATAQFLQHRLDELVRWVGSFPNALVFADPNLSSIVAYALVRQGRVDAAEAYLVAAEGHWRAAHQLSGLAVVAIVRGAIARFRDDAHALIEWSVTGLALANGEPAPAPPDDVSHIRSRFVQLTGTWMERLPQMISAYQLALGLVGAGRLAEADAVVEQQQAEHAAAGIEMTSTYVGSALAMVRLAQGRLAAAESVTRPYARLVREDGPLERALAMRIQAEVVYEWNRLDDAGGIVDDALRLLQLIGSRVVVPSLHILRARIAWSRGDDAGAIAALESAARGALIIHNLDRHREAEAMRARIALAGGDIASAHRWASRRGLSPDSDLTTATLAELLVYARMLIAIGETERSLALLTRLRTRLEGEGRRHDLLKVLIVISLAYLDLYELDHAAGQLGAALAIGEEGGYLRAFIDEGEPMFRLLRVAHRRGVSVAYIREVLAAVGQEPGDVQRVTHREIAEPITSREIEVLRFIALGLTNKEISEELYLSVATVKRHITNLYGKLGVASRTDAVQRARRLGILSAEQGLARRLAPGVAVD